MWGISLVVRLVDHPGTLVSSIKLITAHLRVLLLPVIVEPTDHTLRGSTAVGGWGGSCGIAEGMVRTSALLLLPATIAPLQFILLLLMLTSLPR